MAGVLILKVVVAAVFLWHGVPKALDWTAASEKFAGWGLPNWSGPLTGVVEVAFAPLLFWRPSARIAAAVLLVVILGALAVVQIPGGVTAGLERDLLVAAALVAILAAHAETSPATGGG